jgi:type IV pilus assembly protein PilE
MKQAGNRRAQGLTLIELMVVVAVIGILAAVAYPSYRSVVAKGRRSDARAALLDLAQRMERQYTERSTYAAATLGATGIYPGASPQGYYTMSITAQTATAFTIKATPTGVQSSDACGSFQYDNLGTKTVSGGTLGVSSCW